MRCLTLLTYSSDDLAIKGPEDCYLTPDATPEVLYHNPGIRRFIWEHACDLHRILHHVQHAGGTFSPTKIQLARPSAVILGQQCNPRRPTPR